MKKLLLSILTISIMFLNVPNVSAEEIIQELSNQELQILDDLYDEVPDLYDPNENIISVSKIDHEFIAENSSYEIIPYGIISKSDMTLYITVSKLSAKRFSVKATATWKITPFYQRRDALGIAWGRNHTHISSYTTERYQNGDVSYLGQLIKSTPNKGVAYDFPIRKVLVPSAGIGTPLKSVTLTTTIETNNTGSSNVVANYGHAMLSLGNFSAEISGSPSITFSISGKYDNAVAESYFYH